MIFLPRHNPYTPPHPPTPSSKTSRFARISWVVLLEARGVQTPVPPHPPPPLFGPPGISSNLRHISVSHFRSLTTCIWIILKFLKGTVTSLSGLHYLLTSNHIIVLCSYAWHNFLPTHSFATRTLLDEIPVASHSVNCSQNTGYR